jgi:hypothetical protein
MRWILLGLASLVLAGCKSETVSFLLAGSDAALTLERRKPYFWSEGWELDLVARNNPQCQRRHRLKPAGNGVFKVEVFMAEPTVFIVRQAKRWYVTDLRTCQLQQFKEEPPEPGELVGAFQVKGGVLRFVEVKDKAPAEEDKPAGGD